MAKIFMAVVDNAHDRADLEKSVIRPVERQLVIRNFSDSTYPELLDIERLGHGFYTWGLEPTSENVESWFVMGRGDYLLLGYKGMYRHYAKILGRYENEKAARDIWGDPEPDGGVLRTLLFFISEPLPLSQPYEQLAEYLPVPTIGFSKLPDEVIGHIEGDFISIERFIRRRFLNNTAGGPALDISGMIRISERELSRLQVFDPDSSKTGRNQLIESIIRRRGSPTFRQRLLAAYNHRCAITSFSAMDALEAAYIIPYRGRYTHHPSNGLLLRADIHTLFDLGKIAVDTRTMTVVVADDLLESSYRIISGRPLRLPENTEERPSTESLDLHRRLSGL